MDDIDAALGQIESAGGSVVQAKDAVPTMLVRLLQGHGGQRPGRVADRHLRRHLTKGSGQSPWRPGGNFVPMKYAQSVLDLIGNTPLIKLNHVTEGIKATVLVKLEYINPGGSIKDRIAVKMIEDAEKDGRLKPGGTIVEPTSGNTGVGLALVAQQKGYKCIFVVPDKVGEDKRAVLQAYGAEVVVTPTAVAPDSPQSYYGVSDRLVKEIPGAFKPDQFSNPRRSRQPLRVHGPGNLAGHRRAGHARSHRRRYRRHHHWNRPLPQAGLGGPFGDRRRPGQGHRS